MKLGRTATLLTLCLAVLWTLLFAWARVGKTQQDQTAKKNQQIPTIEVCQPKSILVTKEHKIERARIAC